MLFPFISQILLQELFLSIQPHKTKQKNLNYNCESEKAQFCGHHMKKLVEVWHHRTKSLLQRKILLSLSFSFSTLFFYKTFYVKDVHIIYIFTFGMIDILCTLKLFRIIIKSQFVHDMAICEIMFTFYFLSSTYYLKKNPFNWEFSSFFFHQEK